jgi:small subunit ribosomal protein S4
MKMHKQFKAKPCKRFGAALWKHRKLTLKQEKAILLNKKKMNMRKISNFSLQLRAKQLVSTLYGQLRLQQFKQLIKKSEKYKGKMAHILFSLLEKRVDSCLVQLKFAPTFLAARQLINHQKVFVNNQIVKSPSFILNPGDLISFKDDTKEMIAANVQTLSQQQQNQQVQIYKSLHFEVNYKTLEAIFLFSPQQIHYPTQIEPELIVKSLR